MILDASIIIPTYNRCESLAKAFEALHGLDFPAGRYEIVIVDNNSNDDTPAVAERFREEGLDIKYIKETRLSFTVARHTGADAASGRILCYIDDDVMVSPGWLSEIVKVFAADDKVGMVGGRIDPVFEVTPPAWALTAQQHFNGWSLWNPYDDLQEAPGACGPNLCVRADVLKEVGGFPPDTIGVESASKKGTVEKIYVGDGDWGLSCAVRKAGYRVMYAPKARVDHVIPPVRLTKEWWQSRLTGEGYMRAFCARVRERPGRVASVQRIVNCLYLGGQKGVSCFLDTVRGRDRRHIKRFMMKAWWHEARVEYALARRPEVASKLWEMALSGVPPGDINELVALLP